MIVQFTLLSLSDDCARMNELSKDSNYDIIDSLGRLQSVSQEVL